MKKLIVTMAILMLAACGNDIEFKGFPYVGEKYPYKAKFSKNETMISSEFTAPSPDGEFFGLFQEVKIQYLSSDRTVFRVVGNRTYIDHDACEVERKKLWGKAINYFGAPTNDGQGNWNFNFGNQVLNLFCGVAKNSPHAFLNVTVTDVPLIDKQVKMHIEAVKH